MITCRSIDFRNKLTYCDENDALYFNVISQFVVSDDAESVTALMTHSFDDVSLMVAEWNECLSCASPLARIANNM